LEKGENDMSRQNLHGQQAHDLVIWTGLRFGTANMVLAANLPMDRDMPTALSIDAVGTARNVLLPPEEEGLAYLIFNTSSAAGGVLTLQTSAGAALSPAPVPPTIPQNSGAWVVCVNGKWRVSGAAIS
jgi:hypothetical protein